MEIIAHGKDTYEVVDEIPVGYTIWNIGKHAPEGYLPLCRPAREQPFEGARSIDADALKAIKVEGAEEIMKAFGRGEETLDEFEQYVSRNKNSEHCDIKHRVELYERAIPYMKRVKGIEHLTKWEDCTMRTTMRELFVHFYLNEKEICSYDLRNEFADERASTIKQLAYEYGVDPSEIMVFIGGKKERPKSFAMKKREKLASEMSVHELAMELRSRPEVVAVQVWQEEDVENAFETQKSISDPDAELVAEVCNKARSNLENCEHGWDAIYAALDEVVPEQEDC